MDKYILRFNAADVLRILEHSTKAPKQSDYYDEPIREPSFFLVKDDGIYLMSAGLPADTLEDPAHPERKFVAYAVDYDPRQTDPDTLWERTHTLSPDDFAEPLEVKPWMIKHASAGRDLRLTLTPENIIVEFYK